MSTQIIKTVINVFIMLAFVVSIYQDLATARAATVDATNHGPQAVPDKGPEIQGVVLKVSDNLRKPVHDMLTAEKYNVKIEGYDFEGNQWWWETAIQYGHIIIVYILLGKYQTESDGSKKTKIIIVGLVTMLVWFSVLPNFKTDRLKIQIKGKTVYENTVMVPQEIITAISDGVDLYDVQEFDDAPKEPTNPQPTTQTIVEEQGEFEGQPF